MALKALMLRHKIDLAKKNLEALREKEAGYAQRETELEAAIAEAVTAEEQAACEAEVETFEAERSENTAAIADLEGEIRDLEEQLAEEERQQNVDPAPESEQPEEKTERREANIMPETRNRFGLTEEILRREDNAAFLAEVRSAIKERRNITNAGLLVSDTFLGIIKENVINYSKLYRHVYVRRLNGEGKLAVMGTVPEAVWEACCSIINEITLGINQVTVDCNKVAAFIPVCNSIIDDSDIALASEIIQALLIALGKALDKAILYGTGSGMPLGVYTRLSQTSQPASYPAAAPAWVDLHTSNKLSIANSVTGIALFQTLMLDSAVMSGKYSRGELVWCMNDTTYKYLKAQGMSVNAAGQIVSAVEGQMPAAGGIVEVLDFIPNYNIIAGYFDLYLLADRQGMVVDSSNLPRFIEDETVFRARGRYDGLPVIANAFAAFAINSADFSGVTFAADTANTPAYVILSAGALAVTAAAGTNHAKQLTAIVLNAAGQKIDATVTWASSVEAKATVDTTGKVTGAASGNTVVSATAGTAVGVCNVTVS